MCHSSVADSSRNGEAFVSPRHDVSLHSASLSPSVSGGSVPTPHTPREYATASSTATVRHVAWTATGAASVRSAIRCKDRAGRVGAGRGEGREVEPSELGGLGEVPLRALEDFEERRFSGLVETIFADIGKGSKRGRLRRQG